MPLLCPACEKTLPEESFNKDRSRARGYQTYCRVCQNSFYQSRSPRNRIRDNIKTVVKNLDDNGNVISKECSTCHTIKDLNKFPRQAANSSGYTSSCLDCANIRSKNLRKLYKSSGINPDKIRFDKCKNEVFSHYSKGIPHCACCGNTYMNHLSIDHINQDGAAHRRSLTGRNVGGGPTMWKWLKDNNYPEEFRVLCINCNRTVYHYGECRCIDSPRILNTPGLNKVV